MQVVKKTKSALFKLRLLALSFLHAAFSASLASESCVCCGKKSFFMPVCHECAKKYLLGFFPPGNGRCKLCGKILLVGNDLCSSCREKRLLCHADSVFPLWPYRLWMKGLLFEWKMGENRSISPLFAECVEKAIEALYPGRGRGDIPLVPVPPRPGKLKNKGWDQIEELCSIIHHRYKRPILRLLKRVSSQQLMKLDRMGGLLIGCSSYKVNAKKLKKAAKNGSLPLEALLLDDVMTTGATVEACAAVLKGVGIRKVQVITLFIVD
ncbi:MAG: ComF family protein [Treponema sp.]|nr:ComF family protein [Treponema sp.]